jgi:hypothetical protein
MWRTSGRHPVRFELLAFQTVIQESRWPKLWQLEAIELVAPLVDSDRYVEIWVGDPLSSVDGTLMAGYLYTDDDGQLLMCHGRGGYDPWPLWMGPVLRVEAASLNQGRSLLYNHPEWTHRPQQRQMTESEIAVLIEEQGRSTGGLRLSWFPSRWIGRLRRRRAVRGD